ncbi:MAG TPA: FCD domain-containing protein [Rubrivivax sp.]|nr:FCD domain-containing protein [Rubrivivax sp.]
MGLDIARIHFSPAYRAVSDDLRRRIVAGDIAQGDSLPTETELATRFGVHRSTIREGLRQLEQEGLLRRDGKRLLASMPRHSDMASAAERALRMRQVSFLDIWQVASVLEPLCAQLAAATITEDELEALEHNLERTQRIVAAGESAVEIDMEFQALVAAATHNPALLIARGPISLLMRAGYAAIAPQLPQSGARLLEVHRQVLAALRRRDADAAESWMRKHMQDYRRGCEVAGLDMRQPVPPAP